ncbi:MULTISPECIES: hypothetical protein [Streptomyces]|uniref:hypothetical protein n=1 Tax=Streptomyces TaxID=1883 RepID=UPI001C5F6B9B|nr:MULTISPECIES: hypothetical protein [Streptomyces]MBW5252133.1 hypothetical protein [Streptomyces poriferorum]MBW5260848.1 hypothetical protein [Streptomyces poriferorum]WSI63824.1 hypothetical protein OG471_17925 [Streptomyces sp. NBC_01336]
MTDLPPRLLPWASPEGKPCWLSTDDPGSLMSRLADDMEDEQIECGEQVWAGSRAVLADRAAGERAVRFALTRATESLGDLLRIAQSRGHRMQRQSPENAAQN